MLARTRAGAIVPRTRPTGLLIIPGIACCNALRKIVEHTWRVGTTVNAPCRITVGAVEGFTGKRISLLLGLALVYFCLSWRRSFLLARVFAPLVQIRL